MNERIRAREVRVIGTRGTDWRHASFEALKMAAKNLDLVEISRPRNRRFAALWTMEIPVPERKARARS